MRFWRFEEAEEVPGVWCGKQVHGHFTPAPRRCPSPSPPQGPYITEAGTPVADMWEQQFGHVDKKKVGRGGGWL